LLLALTNRVSRLTLFMAILEEEGLEVTSSFEGSAIDRADVDRDRKFIMVKASKLIAVAQ